MLYEILSIGIVKFLSPTISTMIAKFGFAIGRFSAKYFDPNANVSGWPAKPPSSASKKYNINTDIWIFF